MEELLLLVAIVVILGPVLSIVALLFARGARMEARALKDEIAELRATMEAAPAPKAAPLRTAADSTTSTVEADEEQAPESAPEADGDAQPDAEMPVAEPEADAEFPDEEPAPDAEDEAASGAWGPPPTDVVEPARPRGDIESAIGAKWAVWVGGVAMALGALFLVKYSIDQGLLSPAVRIAMGLGFSALLCAAGEWARRRPNLFEAAAFERANIPAILTAAGSFGAFGSIFAAFALYGFFSPTVAFLALGAIAVATTLAALLHGPMLAPLGLVGSLAVPFLIPSPHPNYLALAFYILAASAAALAVARIRLWRWLAAIAAVGLVFYGIVIMVFGTRGDALPITIYVLAAWAMVFAAFVASFGDRRPAVLPKSDWLATAALVLLSLLVIGIPTMSPPAFLIGVALIGLIVLAFAGTHDWPGARYAVLGAAIATGLSYIGWSVPFYDLYEGAVVPQPGTDPDSFPLPFQLQESVTLYVGMGAAIGAVAAALGLRGAMASVARAMLATGGVLVPVLVLAAAYVRVEAFVSSMGFGLAALLLSGAFAGLAGYIDRTLPDDTADRDHAVAAYVIGALAALALAAGMVFERGVLTVALALMVPVTGFVYSRRPLKALGPVMVAFAALWFLRVAWDPRIVGGDLGTTPIFNWLLYGYGIPAAGFSYAAWVHGRAARDFWTEVLEAIAVVAVAGAFAVVGLHAIDPASVFTPIDTLPEAAMLTLVGSGVSLGLLQLRRTGQSRTLSLGASILGLLGMAMAVAGLIVAYNPMVTFDPVGPGLFFNALWFAYLATGFVFGLLALSSRGRRPAWYTNAAFATAGLLMAAFVTLTIRLGFHPGNMALGPTPDAELYTYSGVWLAIGIVVLAGGIWRGSRTLRLVSAGIIVAVVVKVFLIDMANLTGVLRAFSFVSLGAVLLAIGFVYQRLLRKE